MFSFRAAIAAGICLALCLGPSVVAAQPASAPARPLTADPALRRGVLPNGLRYALMDNATPKGGLSLRLAFDVGSLDEALDERGVAHFVEHMAFRATRHFPEGRLDPAFAPLGVGYGRDQNATTGHQATVYRLDLPNGEARASALIWLRDVADGVRFEPEAVDRERGVVLSERDVRNEPVAAVERTVETFKGAGLRTTERPPIGDLQVLRTVTPARLQAFYERWYRPEHAVLVVVGDLSPEGLDGLEAEIAKAFGDWRGRGDKPERPGLPGPDGTRGLAVLTLSEPQVSSGVSICRQRPADPSRLADIDALRQRSMRLVWVQALNVRLSELALSDPSILEAVAYVDLDQRELTQTCVDLISVGEVWRPALRAVQTEIARFTAVGPNDLEVEEALVQLRGGALGAIALAATRDSPTLATNIAGSVLLDQVVMEPRQEMRAFNQAVENVTPAEVLGAWRKDWAGAGPFVVVVAPQAPDQAAVLAAWNEQAKVSPPPYVKAATPVWAYGAVGAPGAVAKRQVLTDPDFVRLSFRNGVVLNLKQTAFTKGQVEVRVDFGGGREELGNRSLQEGFLATDSFMRGGLGRHAYAEIKALAGDELLGSIDLVMNNRSFALESDAFPDWLGTQFRVMAAYLTDPGFRDELDVKLPSVVANVYRDEEASPVQAIYQGLREAVAPGGPRSRPPRAELAALRSRDFEGLLRTAVTSSPLEVTLVGDIDEPTAVDLVGRTFGALPERRPRAARPPYSSYLRYPQTVQAPVSVTHAGAADQAAVALVWPLFVLTAERRREEVALTLLAALFDDELRHAVRERLGKAYSPSVEVGGSRRADQATLTALVETAPGDLATVEAAMRDLAARLAAGDITPQMLEAARNPLLAGVAADLTDNAVWATQLQDSARDPQAARDLVEPPRLLAQITLDEVKQAAAVWLGSPPIVVVATPEIRK